MSDEEVVNDDDKFEEAQDYLENNMDHLREDILDEMDGDPLQPFLNFKKELNTKDEKLQVQAIRNIYEVARKLHSEDIKRHLLPYLDEYVSNNNSQFHQVFADELHDLVDLLKDPNDLTLIFNILDTFVSNDEEETRDTAVDILVKISERLDKDVAGDFYLDVIGKLWGSSWYGPKISAAALFKPCYKMLGDDQKENVLNMFLDMCRLNDPDTNQAYVKKLPDFMEVLDESTIRTKVFTCYKDWIKSENDTLQINCLKLIPDLSKHLREDEVEEYAIRVIKILSKSANWKVRVEVAKNLAAYQKLFRDRFDLMPTFKILSRDGIPVIREIIEAIAISFAKVIQTNQKEDVMKIIKYIYESELHGSIMNESLMELKEVFSLEEIKKYLLPLVGYSVNVDKVEVGSISEFSIRNLSEIIEIIGFGDDVRPTVEKLLFALLSVPTLNWRSRRYLLIVMNCVANHSDREYFTKSIAPFYQKLLGDTIRAIRVCSPMILPLLYKKFGMTWTKRHCLNKIFYLRNHTNYLYRMGFLLCVDELVEPSLFKTKIEIKPEFDEISLQKISYLNELLENMLKDDWVLSLIEEQTEQHHDDIKFYAENFANHLEDHDGYNGEHLQELLALLIKYVLSIMHELSKDKIENVRSRCANSLKKITRLQRRLKIGLQYAEFECIPSETEQAIKEELKLAEACMEEEIQNLDRGMTFERGVVDNEKRASLRTSLHVKSREFMEQMNQLELIETENHFEDVLKSYDDFTNNRLYQARNSTRDALKQLDDELDDFTDYDYDDTDIESVDV